MHHTLTRALLALSLLLTPLLAAAERPPLAYAPADTPYVFASIDPLPEHVASAWRARANRDSNLLIQLLRAPAGDTAESPSASGLMLQRALAAELEAAGSMAAFGEAWGLSQQARSALFGVGMMPVMRVELADAARFKEKLTALAARTGITIEAAELEEQAYWRMHGKDGGFELLVALHGGHLVVALGPAGGSERLLRAAFGIDLPESSLLDSGALQALNERVRFLPYGSGYIDHARLWAALADPSDEQPDTEFRRALGWREPAVGAGCQQVADLFTRSWPRLAVGYDSVDVDGHRLRYLLEATPDKVQKLRNLQAPIVDLEEARSAPLSAVMSLRADRLVALVLDWGSNLRGDCVGTMLLAIKLGEWTSALSNPVLEDVSRHLASAHVRIDRLDPPGEHEWPEVTGSLLLYSDDPQAALADLRDEDPEFQIELEPGAAAIPAPVPNLFLASGDKALGLAMGRAAADALPTRLSRQSNGPTPLFQLSYDGALLGRVQELMLADASPSEAAATLWRQAIEAQNRVRRATLRLEVVEHGLEMSWDTRYR
jgi:hypothetical protein